MEQLELCFDLENEQSVTEIYLQNCASIEHVIVVEKDSCNYHFLQKNGTKYLHFFHLIRPRLKTPSQRLQYVIIKTVEKLPETILIVD